jgi:hypothetical protein|tara:strand:+ start:1959 stop:3338 length:1380 start_codon:yes stop_codon:yes gene_type:complete
MAIADIAQGLQDYLQEKRAEDIAAEERERLERERAEDRKLINEARRLNADTRRLNTLSKKVDVTREVGGSASPALIGELEAAGSPERGYFEADAYVPSGTGEAPGHLGQSEFFLRPTAEEQDALKVQNDLRDYIIKSTPAGERREQALALVNFDPSGALGVVHAEPETQEYNRILQDGTQHRVSLTPDQVRPYNAGTGTGDRLVGGHYPTKQATPDIFARKEKEIADQGTVRQYMYPSEYNLLNAPESQGGAGGNLDILREEFPDKAARIDDADAAYGRIAFARQQARERGETITEEQFLNLLPTPEKEKIITPIPPEDQEIASIAEQYKGPGNYMPDADVEIWMDRKISQKYQRDTSPLEWKAERDRLLGKLRNAGVVSPGAPSRLELFDSADPLVKKVGGWLAEGGRNLEASSERHETWYRLFQAGVTGVKPPFPRDRDPSAAQVREFKRLVAGQGR